MTTEELDLLKRIARQRVASYDQQLGGYKDRSLTTILAALDAGLHNPESGALFDAYVMLEEHIESLRGAQ